MIDRGPRAVALSSPTSTLIAPWWHTALLVLLMLGGAAGGAAFQNQSPSAAEEVRHPNALVPLYLSLIVFEWLLFLYVWWGLSRHNRRIGDLLGPRWSGWKQALRDVVIALLLWMVFRAIGPLVTLALGHGDAKSISSLLPRSPAELVLWAGISISAGVCEETVYRGYLQTQLSLLTRSEAIGLIAQAALFGISHGYQGLHPVVTITIGGIVCGLVARWRRNLRPLVLEHAWSDIVGIFPWG